MSRYSEFFLNSASSIVQLELVEIYHPSFSKRYRVVRNAINGITVTLETSEVAFFEYYPLQIKPTGVSDDLDQTLEVQLGDLGEIIPQELDHVMAAGTFNIKPTLVYRTYRSDDLTQPLYGPFRYVISSMPFTKEGAMLNAGAPRVNQNTTGEIYTINRFPTLQGFL